ncbi:hypothetical protein GC176_18465 [bacterium]|nr:hypothetical protein [bacterium]
MVTFRVQADITEDRRIELTVPNDVPLGRAEFVVALVAPANDEQRPPRTSLAAWAEDNAEEWGKQLDSTDVAGFTGRSF